MKLFYWESPHGNVGDDLNNWLWPKVLNDVLDDNEEELIVGVGTVLNEHLPEASKYIVLSSGYGYGNKPDINENWEFLAVRGPRTVSALNLSPDLLTLDGAYLLNRYIDISNIKKQRKLAFIPHVYSMDYGPWKRFEKVTGIKVIDPRLSVEAFVEELARCEVVVCEAMHGAIIADTFGIPWIPAKMYDHININKWFDWTESLNQPIEFNYLPHIWIGDEGLSTKRKVKNSIKRALKACNLFMDTVDDVPARHSSNQHLKHVANEIIKLVDTKPAYSVDRQLINTKTDELLLTIEKRFNIQVSPSKISI